MNIANAFYNQPLLPMIRDDLHIPLSEVGLIPSCFQGGYAVAMLLLVPLADRFDTRKLILSVAGCSIPFLIAIGFAHSLPVLLAAALAISATSILPQLFIPLVARLAAPEHRGQAIGIVASGMLVGLLLARTVAGFVGAYVGWRAVFWVGAGLMGVLWTTLWFALPASPGNFSGSYRQLLGSLVRLVKEQPMIRRTGLSGLLMFMAFYMFWGALDFLLESPAYRLGARTAGLFGLIGAAGALAAPLAGRFSDRTSALTVSMAGIVCCVLGYGVMLFGTTSMLALVLGVIVVDFGAQSAHVSNQNRLYGTFPEARSRLASIYIFCTMCGGAAGAFLGVQAWALGGWRVLCACAIALFAISLAILRGGGVVRNR